jgi:hypothetical protein
MRRRSSIVSQIARKLPPGAAAIAAGLAILTVAMLFPGSPAVAGMALVVLGATGATLTRYRGNPAILPILLAHLFVYGSLYALFVGSAVHAAAHSGEGPSAHIIFDLALSIGPLAVALERVWRELNIGRISE